MKFFSAGAQKLYNPVIILLALFNVLFHLVFAGNLEYHRDELLYFTLGSHPDFGYMTVPPLIGWISWLMQTIFGYSVYAVRVFPALLSGAMIILAAELAREMGGSRYASFLAALGLSVSIFFMRSFSLFHPVHIEIFLWTLCIWFLIRYVNSGKEKYLVMFGIAAGFAMLNKYLAGLLFAGLLLIVPFTMHRAVFSRKAFWYGILAGTIIFLPNLLWQAVKGFPVFGHIGELYETQLVHVHIGQFLSEQLLMPFAGSFFTVAGVVFLLGNRSASRYRFAGWLCLFIILSLLLLKGKHYYTLGVFPFLISAGAVAYEKWLKGKILKMVFPVIIILITLPLIPMGIPVFPKEGMKEYFRNLDQRYGIDAGRRFEDGTIHSLPQDYADMIGWEELAAITDSAWKMIENRNAAFIYAENYGQAGAVTIIGKQYGLPQAVCFSESFRYWIPDRFNPDITSLIYINDELGDDIQMVFRDIKMIGSISDPDAREFSTAVYLCRDPVGSFNQFWEIRLRELEAE